MGRDVMETVTIVTATGVIGIVGVITTETGIAMETEIGTATVTGIATAAATATVAMATEAEGTVMTGEAIGMGETRGAMRGGTKETIALLFLSHQNVEKADGTTEKENKVFH